MIKQLINKQAINMIGKNLFSSGHATVAPQRLQKVQTKLIYLYIKNIDNVFEKVPAFQGESLLETITRMQVKGFKDNICHGYDMTYRPHIRPHDPFTQGPQCGKCRVVLLDNWYPRVNEETEGIAIRQKQAIQFQNPDVQANTRLACCVPIQPWMQGMTLSIDPQIIDGERAEFA